MTAKELDVLRWIASGLIRKEVAEACGVTEGTVQFAVKRATKELGARNRTDAVVIALKRGLLRIDELPLRRAERS